MENRVDFQDYVEVQSADLDNIGLYAQKSFDDIVHDAVTASLRYAGFQTTKTNTAEVTVQAGRFYGPNLNGQVGAVFAQDTATIMNLVQYLAVSATRYVTLAVTGVEISTNTQTRDKLINVTTGQMEPQNVDLEISRQAQLSVIAGAEGTNPVPPTPVASAVAIANILMDPNGVVSVTMLTKAQITSTEDLDDRLIDIEAFDAQIGPSIIALKADLADLANQIRALSQQGDLSNLYRDVAELKAKEGLPAVFSNYAAFYFLWPDPTAYDVTNTQSLGYLALIQNGIRFPAQNAANFALSMFNPIDPNATYNTGTGLLLPAYTSVLKLQTGAYNSSVAMGQYGFQTFALVQKEIAYSRIRDGGAYFVCSNGNAWQTPGDTTVAWWLPNFSTYETVTVTDNGNPNHLVTQTNYYWHDSWTEPYWELDTINHSVNGAQLWQSFLVGSDMWITQLAIWIQAIASPTADVWLTLCECTNGTPDLNKVRSHTVMPNANLKAGDWNALLINPTFAAKGERLAVVVTSNANHQIGVAAAGSYLGGTFGYSLDGAYFLGDFTKDMMLQIWGAQFTQAQVTIQLNSLNLAGGIRDIDLTARMIVPGSCQLVFEVLPDGGGTWLPITPDNPLVPFQAAPVLCQFRARFLGTQDIAPGIVLTDSICKIWCPGPTFTFVSNVETLAAATTELTLRITVENYNTVAHTILPRLYYGAAYHTATSVTTTLEDASAGRYTVVASFTALPSTSTFTLTIGGTTNSVADTYHIAEAVYWT